MPIEASTEQQQSHSSGGWTLDGEYVPAGKKRGDAEASEGEACKARYRGIKGLDGECG